MFGLGLTPVDCWASDSAGNTSHATFVVTVAYSWSGVLQPVNQDGSSVFKLGSTVPVKFRLTGPSGGIGDATARIYVAKIDNNVLGMEVEASSSTPANTGSLFRYDPVDDLYIYNYGTKTLTAGTYRIRIDLGDGQTRTAQFSLRK